MIGATASVVFGADARLVDALDRRARVGVAVHVAVVTGSVVACGAAAAAGSRALGRGDLRVTLVGLLFGAFVWNLFRLLYAGSGIAARYSSEAAARWRPPLWPLLPFAVLAVALAQGPLLLASAALHAGDEQDYRAAMVELHHRAHMAPLESELAELRAELARIDAARAHDAAREARLRAELTTLAGAAHDATQASLAKFAAEAASAAAQRQALETHRDALEREHAHMRDHVHAPYKRYIEQAEVPLLHARLMWAEALTPWFTALFVLVVGAPIWLRTLWPSSLRAYEMAARVYERTLIERAYLHTEAFVQPLLRAELAALRKVARAGRPGYGELAEVAFADAPFDTVSVPGQWSDAVRITGRGLLDKLASTAGRSDA